MVGMKEEAVERTDEERSEEDASWRSRESKRDSSPREGVEVNVRVGGTLMLLWRCKEDCSASAKLLSQIKAYNECFTCVGWSENHDGVPNCGDKV